VNFALTIYYKVKAKYGGEGSPFTVSFYGIVDYGFMTRVKAVLER